MTRVVVQNPADGGFFYWLLKFYAFGAIALTEISVVAGLGLYASVTAHAPDLDSLHIYQSSIPLTTRVRAWDGQLLAEFARERRDIVEIDRLPPRLVEAFRTAEDRRFYRHAGLDVRGIARAAWANLRAGTVRQGGSTITQQVAKAFLGSERTITRKLREAVLARQLERRFSKREILYLYLNTIFLGHGAYGVAAASARYFGKKVEALSIDEIALLAALARAPSRYSPATNPKRAKRRRDLVLHLMHAERVITDVELDGALATPIRIASPTDPYRLRAPYAAEHVRRLIKKSYSEDTLYRGGLSVETSADLHLSALARRHMDFELRQLDKRQGWRGPVAHLSTKDARRAFLQRARETYPKGPIEAGRPYLALVESVRGQSAQLRVGAAEAIIRYSGLSWAFDYSVGDARNFNPKEEKEAAQAGLEAFEIPEPVPPAGDFEAKLFKAVSVAAVLHPGDVVWISRPSWQRPPRPNQPYTVKLDQTPRIEGAVFTFDHQTGYVLAQLGGFDFDRSNFDRVTQACRQPGSTFKPIYYSLALDGSYSMASVLKDKPYVPEPGEEWNPQNIHGTLDGRVTLWMSLVRSLNLPSIQLLVKLGPDAVAGWARRLGLTTPIHADKALALGASCTRLDELSRAFAVFARGGTMIEPRLIRRVLDRDGRVLEDHTAVADPWLDTRSRLDRLAAMTGDPPKQVISKRTAFLTSKLLRDSVARGIAIRANSIGAPAAGKSGTSSDTMDVSFMGYTSRWFTSTWVGDDTYQRPLGAKEASYSIVIPLWSRYMRDAIGERPHQEIPWQPMPSSLVAAVIDPASGDSLPPGSEGVRVYLSRKQLAEIKLRPPGGGNGNGNLEPQGTFRAVGTE